MQGKSREPFFMRQTFTLPISAAAIRKQAPVVVRNLLHLLAGRGPELSAMQWALGVICAGLILLERLS